MKKIKKEKKRPPDFVGDRAFGAYYYLSLMDSAVAADIRSSTACFFDKCSPCLSLVPKTGATPSDLAFGPYFFAGYGNTIRLDNLKNSCFPVIFQEITCPT